MPLPRSFLCWACKRVLGLQPEQIQIPIISGIFTSAQSPECVFSDGGRVCVCVCVNEYTSLHTYTCAVERRPAIALVSQQRWLLLSTAALADRLILCIHVFLSGLQRQHKQNGARASGGTRLNYRDLCPTDAPHR